MLRATEYRQLAGRAGRAGVLLNFIIIEIVIIIIVELVAFVDDYAMHHLKDVACRHHYQGIQSKESVLRATEYRQMAGRAGRAGIDTQGEAILLANNPQLGKQLLELMQVRMFSTCTYASTYACMYTHTYTHTYTYTYTYACTHVHMYTYMAHDA